MEPVTQGSVERDGCSVHYEVFGTGRPTIMLLPTWTIVPSLRWKMQVPYLARHHRVVTFDGRGCGRSDRPTEAAAYAADEYARDAVAVLDATGTDQAVLVGTSMGAGFALRAATLHPERVAGIVFVAPSLGLAEPVPGQRVVPFDVDLGTDEDWARYNRFSWLRDWPGFAELFFREVVSEPHSSKLREDCTAWAIEETDPATMVLTQEAPYVGSPREVLTQLAALRCPTLVVHGDRDVRVHVSAGHRVARATGGELVIMHGSGHLPDARDPVRFNRIVRDFVARLGLVPACPEERRWTRSVDRAPTVLYLSSAIGLGHARRDLAIVAALREQRPEVRVDWLAQHPVTALLERAGERVHPASRFLASESSHVEQECGEHDLRVFQAYRTMDEVLCSNFQVVQDVVEDGTYDLLVGDEAWETDFYLHENPELKRTGFVWMTDFVGWLPMASGGDREALLTADYNAEMLEQVARLPRVRDRALFVGDAADIVPDAFGPGLPGIREWTEKHFDLVGYIGGGPVVPPADRAAVRAELGFGQDERVCVVAVGGTSVGTSLLRRVIAAWPEVHRDVPDLRMLVVTGPRIDPRSLTGALPDLGRAPHGLDVRAFVPDLWRHLAVCDVAVVQSGLTTTMELVANARPFVHVPLRNHFEQQIHVRHRLARYRAGHYMDYDDIHAEKLVPALRRLLDEPVTSLPVRPGGAGVAAMALSQIL